MVLDYEGHLCYFITASANSRHILTMKMDAAATGNGLLVERGKMSIRAGSRLEGMQSSPPSSISLTKSLNLEVIAEGIELDHRHTHEGVRHVLPNPESSAQLRSDRHCSAFDAFPPFLCPAILL
jgi:hypothetical protein